MWTRHTGKPPCTAGWRISWSERRVFWQRADRSSKETAAIRLGVVLTLLAMSPMCAGAAVYQCTAKDGTITYSDSRCGPDAKAASRYRGPTASHGVNTGQAEISDQPAAKQPAGCLGLDQLDNTRTPPDLYLGVSACIQQDNYRAAVALFALGG